MAMQVGGDGSGVKSDINVTPLVDVMLVLLIIVMLVAPLVQQGVSLTLPVAANTSDHPETAEQTTVSVSPDGGIWVNGVRTADPELRQAMEDALEGKSDRIVLIKGDSEADYGDVMHAMDELRAIGIEDMALITDPEPGSRRGGE